MTPPRTKQPAAGDAAWTRYRDERLLDVRMCDLGLELEDTEVQPRVRRLFDELADRGLGYRPNVWLSDEWFSPRETPGIAVPFFLAHPRLKRLERKMMLDVEGGTARDCMRLLRHECGHAFQFAYGLHRRKRWREMFGSATEPYPEAYRPEPHSRDFVLHLDNHYAQAHPDEDFAETFATWLTPGLPWRRRYARWPALAKLEYVDALMAEIADRPPADRRRRRVRPLRSLRMTLRAHYDERRERYGLDDPDIYNRDLLRIFDARRPDDSRPPAVKLLRRWRRELLKVVGDTTGLYAYTTNEVYGLMIERARQLGLRVPDGRCEEDLKRDTAVLLAVQTMVHLQRGGRWITI